MMRHSGPAQVPLSDYSERTGIYRRRDFTYHEDQDVYTCPQAKESRLHTRRKSDRVLVYRAGKGVAVPAR